MIVIPMAGLSSRFKKEGYKQPKYMLEAHGKTLFEHAVLSFQNYFDSERFLFIALSNEFDVEGFLEDKIDFLGIKDYDIVILNEPTDGQAQTVYLGLQQTTFSPEHITVFNIDTFRPNFVYPSAFDISQIDGYLETFIGSGANWSNVLPVENSNRVQYTAEKKEISHYCCTGLYYFRSSTEFMDLFEKVFQSGLDSIESNEYYIAPMYNFLIEENKDIRFSVIDADDVIFCGIPSEYESFLTR
jgi:NDP-sugar pyrophosphorylase family protein